MNLSSVRKSAAKKHYHVQLEDGPWNIKLLLRKAPISLGVIPSVSLAIYILCMLIQLEKK